MTAAKSGDFRTSSNDAVSGDPVEPPFTFQGGRVVLQGEASRPSPSVRFDVLPVQRDGQVAVGLGDGKPSREHGPFSTLTLTL